MRRPSLAGRASVPGMSGKDWSRLVALSVLWGGSFFFIGAARPELPALTIVAARLALGAAALWLVLPRLGIAPPRGLSAWLACAGMGVLNNAIPFSLIAWAQGSLASGLASVVNATTPMMTVLAAHVLTSDEKITRAKLAGVGLGFAGVAVLAGPDAFTGRTDSLPILAMLAATFSYGLSGVFGRRFRRLPMAPEAGALGQLTASALIMAGPALLFDRPWTLSPGTAALAAVAGLGLLSTALAYILFFRVLVSAGPTNLSLATFMIPPTAILLGVAFLGETLQARHIAGIALIAAGLVVIDGRLLRLRALA